MRGGGGFLYLQGIEIQSYHGFRTQLDFIDKEQSNFIQVDKHKVGLWK
jgi:hypothetical protein